MFVSKILIPIALVVEKDKSNHSPGRGVVAGSAAHAHVISLHKVPKGQSGIPVAIEVFHPGYSEEAEAVLA